MSQLSIISAFAASFFLELLVIALCSFPVAYWAPSDLGVHLPVSSLFAFSYCSWNPPGKNTGVVCHSLLEWTMLSELVHLGWPCMAWLIASLSYTNPFSTTRLWSMKGLILITIDKLSFKTIPENVDQDIWNIDLLQANKPQKIIFINAAAAAAKSLQSCPTLCDPRDGSPLGSPVPGILQARTLEWVAISFSSAWKWKVKVKSLSWLQPTRLLRPWDFPGKSTGVGCHCFLWYLPMRLL